MALGERGCLGATSGISSLTNATSISGVKARGEQEWREGLEVVSIANVQ